MTNKEIAGLFHELASLMELYEENPFKIRTYENAYLALRKLDESLLSQTREEWSKIKGIGETILDKLEEIKSTGLFKALAEYRDRTPEGIRFMLQIKGLGPKKVKTIWNDLQIESVGELLYACYENRLIELKGFGLKLQADVIQSIEYFNSQKGLFLFSQLEQEAGLILELLKQLNPGTKIEISGALRRAAITLEEISIICDHNLITIPNEFVETKDGTFIWKERFPVKIYYTTTVDFNYQQLFLTGGSSTFQALIQSGFTEKFANSEIELFALNHVNYIPPECRDLDSFNDFNFANLITDEDIRGVVHNHSNYSDGIYSIEEMVKSCISLGYQYFVISDHSKSAFYANGMQIERLYLQWKEIDNLNEKYKPFRIFKSIESDILSDGSLDYPDEILSQFDFVIASIHSNLKMDEAKAMHRLIQAIENPYTVILGHPTGRLLLSRKGYPVDYKRLIDACVGNHVGMEINANPLRLDMDWKRIPYAMEKNLMISINPDAHNLKGIQDIKYGVKAGRKGGLMKNNCLNAKQIAEFESWIHSKSKF
ncbi:MAG: DNA polymerase/3'-5' exonuclease PolX [Saprospiraceae bacterium]|nr:DNA polymerase/3'-5' exonuclease PolX [Saprospiraceae bacterium]